MKTGSRLGNKATLSRWRGHSVYSWRVSFIEAGKYRRKGFKTKDAAEIWAADHESEALRHGTGASLTLEERSVVLEHRETLQALKIDLRACLALGIEAARRQQQSISVSEAARQTISTRSANGHSARYCADLRNRLARFVTDFGERPVSAVTTPEIASWLSALDLAPASVNGYRRILSVLFGDAVSGGYLERNPVSGVPQIKEIEKAPGILTPDETQALLDNADPEILPALALGAFAGIRSAELERMTWEEVDLAAGFIRIRAENTKSARHRLIPIAENLATWLEGDHVGPIWPANGRKLHEQARKAAGFGPDHPWPENGLRHSFASYHLAYHRDTARLALEMGHADTRLIFRHYRELVTPRQAQSYWGVERSGVVD